MFVSVCLCGCWYVGVGACVRACVSVCVCVDVCGCGCVCEHVRVFVLLHRYIRVYMRAENRGGKISIYV